MRRLLWIIGILALFFPASGTAAVKVACVGDSVTYGARIEDRENDAYPAQLQRMLGPDYEVCNFGRSGATGTYFTV